MLKWIRAYEGNAAIWRVFDYSASLVRHVPLQMPKGCAAMFPIQFKEEPSVSSSLDCHQRSALGNSAASKLIDLGRALACAESGASTRGSCFHCMGPRNSHRSSAQFPSVFCSEQCEREFIRGAIACISVEDCVRIQHRLEALLAGT